MHFRSFSTSEDSREAGNPLFCEHIRQTASKIFPGRYRFLRYHEIDLGFGKLKHEIFRKTFDIPLNLFTQAYGLHCIKSGEILIQHNLLITKFKNPCFDGIRPQ